MTIATSPAALIETHFGELKDPRAAHSIEHKLIDILMLTICATICGANDWEAIAEYGQTKQEWLKTWLELPNGIPSPDTFSRVLARINPTELQKCFMGWIAAVAQVTEGELLNIDGKTLRGAKEAGNSRSLIHMVSVWSASQHLVLGQTKVSEKSNEITAIPPLLEMLAIRGCLVSIDAMGCQTEIAKVIIEQRYYILSIDSDVHKFATAVRSHWSIENQLHWILDVGFGEDAAQSFSGYSAENLAVIRHISVNLLSRDNKSKVGVKTRRLKAGWDDNYLKTVLSALNIVTS
jgi:predicted transposase YbfD/YdcC